MCCRRNAESPVDRSIRNPSTLGRLCACCSTQRRVIVLTPSIHCEFASCRGGVGLFFRDLGSFNHVTRPDPIPQQPLRPTPVADCAVCTQGFAPGVAYSCRECSASSKKLAAGLSAVVGIVVCLVAALISWRMGSVVNERTAEDVAVARSSRGPGRCFCPNLHMRMLPLSAIKIVVTVWQIIYQVRPKLP